jgi:transcriptional regulator with XRE-family HTH domain
MGKVDFTKLLKRSRESEAYLVEKASMAFLKDVWHTMKAKNITQKELADKAGLKESYISRVFSRKGNLTIATMVKLAKCLEKKVSLGLEQPQRETLGIDSLLSKPTPSQEAKVIYTNIHHLHNAPTQSQWETSEDINHERIDSAA